MNSLCVCFTPLNVLIARRVAEINNIKFSKGVFITSVDTEKQRYYAKVMQEFCETVDYTVPNDNGNIKPKHLSILVRRIKSRKFFSQYAHVNSVYIATSYSDLVFEFLSSVRFEKLYTYDDGLINIFNDGTLVRIYDWKAKFFLILAGVTYWPTKFMAKTTLHYTIYHAENSFNPTQFIELTNASRELEDNRIDVKKIFLGALPEASDDMWSLIKESVNQINPDGYLAHPREKVKKVDNVFYIKTPLVAEDYILTDLKNNPNVSYEVYGYDSSALFNLAKVQGVKVISVIPNKPENFPLRNLMDKSGISFLND